MIFVDSWVWLEYFLETESSNPAVEVVKSLETEKGVITSTVLMEVRYRFRQEFGRSKADRLTNAIRAFDNLIILPVTEDLAVRAADLRSKYYEREEREISYADAIHLAAAELSGCEILYTGDKDFRDVEEVEVKIL